MITNEQRAKLRELISYARAAENTANASSHRMLSANVVYAAGAQFDRDKSNEAWAALDTYIEKEL